MNLHHIKKKVEDTFIITKFQRALMPGCNSPHPGSLPLSHSCSLANPATVSPTNSIRTEPEQPLHPHALPITLEAPLAVFPLGEAKPFF